MMMVAVIAWLGLSCVLVVLALAWDIQDVRASAQAVRVRASDMEPTAFLLWFLRNHGNGPLIEAGLWKKPKFIAADLGEEASHVQAAYLLGGEKAAWSTVLALIKDAPIPAMEALEVCPEKYGPAGKPKYLGKKGLDYFDWEEYQKKRGLR